MLVLACPVLTLGTQHNQARPQTHYLKARGLSRTATRAGRPRLVEVRDRSCRRPMVGLGSC